jgi:hypothetical protein
MLMRMWKVRWSILSSNVKALTRHGRIHTCYAHTTVTQAKVLGDFALLASLLVPMADFFVLRVSRKAKQVRSWSRQSPLRVVISLA